VADERTAERTAERTTDGDGPALNLAAVRASLSDAVRVLSQMAEPADDDDG
jgi:hypothetical protein